MNRTKRTYLTLTRPTTQYRLAPMDGTCTGGIRAPNHERQWETEVLKMGVGTGEVSSVGCDNVRGVREGWTGGRLKFRASVGKKTEQRGSKLASRRGNPTSLDVAEGVQIDVAMWKSNVAT